MDRIPTFEEFCLNEGLIRTYGLEVVDKNLNKQLSKINGSTDISDSRKILINIRDLSKYDNALVVDTLVNIEKFLTLCGWFVSNVKFIRTNGRESTSNTKYDIKYIIDDISAMETIDIVCEKKYDDFETGSNIPTKLYHLTIVAYEDKINKNGLSVKSRSKLVHHPDRIYLCKSVSDCEHLINIMKRVYGEEAYSVKYPTDKKAKRDPLKYNKNTDFIIYEIDNSDEFIKELYLDPNFDVGSRQGGYYILQNIHPSKLKLIKRL